MKSRRQAAAHLRTAHQLQLFEGAVAYFEALIKDIDRSRHEVRIETYIFAFQGAPLRVADIGQDKIEA